MCRFRWSASRSPSSSLQGQHLVQSQQLSYYLSTLKPQILEGIYSLRGMPFKVRIRIAFVPSRLPPKHGVDGLRKLRAVGLVNAVVLIVIWVYN